MKRVQIAQGEVAAFEEIGDEQFRRAAEEIEEIANEVAAVLALIDGGLEELRVADLFHFAERAFFFEAIDERLHRGVGDAFVVGETFEDFAHGCGAELPILLEDACFGF